MTHYNSAESSIFGFMTSVIGATVLGFAGNLLSAFILGIVGAFGGWLFHRVMKKYFK